MTITLGTEQIGRRIYVTGNTYEIKNKLKDIGCKFDPDRKQWWIGSSKKSEVEAVVNNLDGKEIKEDLSKKEVYGKVQYKSKSGRVGTYYVIAQGKGRLRLTNLDGSIDFWVDEAVCKWAKRYEARYDSWQDRDVYQTLGGIKRFVEEIKDRTERGLTPVADYPGKECPCCGSEPLNSNLYCWECGYQGQS